MREELENLRSIRQHDDKLEESYRKHSNQAIRSCGNFHEDDEKMTMFIDGLSKTIQAMVARRRESVPRRYLTFEDLLHFSRSEYEAVCV